MTRCVTPDIKRSHKLTQLGPLTSYIDICCVLQIYAVCCTLRHSLVIQFTHSQQVNVWRVTLTEHPIHQVEAFACNTTISTEIRSQVSFCWCDIEWNITTTQRSDPWGRRGLAIINVEVVTTALSTKVHHSDAHLL